MDAYTVGAHSKLLEGVTGLRLFRSEKKQLTLLSLTLDKLRRPGCNFGGTFCAVGCQMSIGPIRRKYPSQSGHASSNPSAGCFTFLPERSSQRYSIQGL